MRLGLDQWKFHLVRKDKDVKGILHHLIIDEHSTGKKAWGEIKTAIIQHLLQPN